MRLQKIKFEKLYRNKINEFIDVIKSMTQDRAKLSLITNSFPIFATSPAIVYLDKRCFTHITEQMKFSLQKRIIFYATKELEGALLRRHELLTSIKRRLVKERPRRGGRFCVVE